MKKNDWILAAAIFFVAVLTFGLQLLKTTDELRETKDKEHTFNEIIYAEAK